MRQWLAGARVVRQRLPMVASTFELFKIDVRETKLDKRGGRKESSRGGLTVNVAGC